MAKDILFGRDKIDPEGEFIRYSFTEFHPGVYQPDNNVVSAIMSHPRFSECINTGKSLFSETVDNLNLVSDHVDKFSDLSDEITAVVEETTGKRVKREDWSAAIYIASQVRKG